jgi:hypothetical protein
MSLCRLRVPPPAVLVAALVAVLVGPLGSGEQARAGVEPRTTAAAVMIPAGAFLAASGSLDYLGDGAVVITHNDGTLVAPLSFPVPVVSIRRITLYVLDESADNDACLYLFRGDPAAGTTLRLGEVCTTGADPTDPQAWTTTDIGPRQVNTAARGAYLSLTLKDGVKVYGVKINYTYETAG